MKLRRMARRAIRLHPFTAIATVLLTVVVTAHAPAHPVAVRPSVVETAPAIGAGTGSPGGKVVVTLTRVSSPAGKADTALEVLAPLVARTSHVLALRTAFQAYYRYRAAHAEEVQKPFLYLVDLGLDNRTGRGWVFDMDALELVEGSFTVAHGRGSGPRQGTPTRFSNAAGSNASSLGLYLAQETYTFTGSSGGRRYASIGLRLRGESGEFNDAAGTRGIVVHGAPYVTPGDAGRSEGCPALERARARRLLPLLANGGVVFIYSPNDARWLARDPWVTGALAVDRGT